MNSGSIKRHSNKNNMKCIDALCFPGGLIAFCFFLWWTIAHRQAHKEILKGDDGIFWMLLVWFYDIFAVLSVFRLLYKLL